MINLMIVDDEEIVRKGIAMSIDWNNYGIAVAGQASNGKTALEIARNVKPDIVITDIKMPIMDGLELSKHLRDTFPFVKLIILTGYKEFEYAKKAIEFKVSEFVLKPIGAEKLLNSVIKLKNEVVERKERENNEKNSIIHINQSEKIFSKAITLGNSLVEEQDLINSMKVLDQNKIGRLLESIFMRLKLVKADYNSLKIVSLRLILAAYRGVAEMGIDIAEQPEMQEDIFQKVEKYETAEDLQSWVNCVISELITIIKKENNYNCVVRSAMDYIIKNYNKSFCLKDIAQKVHVTPNYLCRIFKEETGQSCMEWLNKYRIEKAKKLLKNNIDMKIYEVAECVGFSDYKNFSYNFKKYARCSASKYYAGIESIHRGSC